MAQKYLSDKKIFWISLVIAIGGLVLPAFTFAEVSEPLKMIGIYLKFLLEMIQVSLFEWESNFALEIPYKDDRTFLNYNVLNAFFYILLLLGAIFFMKSKAKETRLLRFVFSIILFSKFVKFIIGLVFFAFYLKEASISILIHTIFSFLLNGFQIYLAFAILKFIRDQKELSSTTKEYGEKQSVVLVETSKWTRFFHHLMDNLVMVLVLSPFAVVLVRIPAIESLINSVAQSFGDRPTLIVLIGIFRMFYYFVFEAILGMTSAKMLSETRVVDEDGNKPSVGKIAVRTLLRIVPFEAFTFFMHSGLHDRSSQTYVVNEKRTGVKGSRYFLIIPIALFLGLATWYGIEKYDEAMARRIYEAEEKQKNEDFAEKVKTLSTNDILTLKSINYDHEGLFLKAEKIENDFVTFVILDIEKDYKPYFGENYSKYQAPDLVEKIYDIEKQNPETIRLSKAQILKSNEMTGEEYYERKVGLTVFGKQFEITEIDAYFGPRLSVYSASDYSENSEIVLQNKGWTADIISVSKFKLQYGELPFRLDKQNYNNVTLSGEKSETYDFEITVKDTLERISRYKIIKKEDAQPTIKRIK